MAENVRPSVEAAKARGISNGDLTTPLQTATEPNVTYPLETKPSLTQGGGLGYGYARYSFIDWFVVPLGWGAVGIMIASFPGASGTFQLLLEWTGVVLWLWACLYWLLLFVFVILQVVIFPKMFHRMYHTPKSNIFGVCSMAFGVCGMGVVSVGQKLMSNGTAVDIAVVLYDINLAAVLICSLIPIHNMVIKQTQTFETVSTLYLFPFLAAIVNGALGAIICTHTTNKSQDMYLVFSSLGQLGCGLLGGVNDTLQLPRGITGRPRLIETESSFKIVAASCIIALYLNRLILYGLPEYHEANVIWLVIGPIGQGANALMQLGESIAAMRDLGYFCTDDNPGCTKHTVFSSFGDSVPGLMLFFGVFMWGFGLFWACAALASTIFTSRRYYNLKTKILRRQRDPNGRPSHHFGVDYWAFVFPLVTLISATNDIYTNTQFDFFLWFTRFAMVLLFIIACIIHIRTIVGVVPMISKPIRKRMKDRKIETA